MKNSKYQSKKIILQIDQKKQIAGKASKKNNFIDCKQKKFEILHKKNQNDYVITLYTRHILLNFKN